MKHAGIKEDGHIAGFAVEDSPYGQDSVEVSEIGFLTSDDPKFSKYAKGAFDAYLGDVANSSYTASYCLVLHEDKSFEAFTDLDIQIRLQVRLKDGKAKGDGVTMKDLKDIIRLELVNIDIKSSDRLVFCFKVGWKFLFYYYFPAHKPLNLEKVEFDLAHVYRWLLFNEELELLQDSATYEQLRKDGWFAFSELFGEDLKKLHLAYKAGDHFNAALDDFLDMFDKARLSKISQRWWESDIFLKHKKVLETGINSFNEGNYISAIHILVPKIDGILRFQLKEDDPQKNVGSNISLDTLFELVQKKIYTSSKHNHSLLLAEDFVQYLKENFSASFNLNGEKVQFSRHSLLHGVLTDEDLTRVRALQVILVLDQIYFGLRK